MQHNTKYGTTNTRIPNPESRIPKRKRCTQMLSEEDVEPGEPILSSDGALGAQGAMKNRKRGGGKSMSPL